MWLWWVSVESEVWHTVYIQCTPCGFKCPSGYDKMHIHTLTHILYRRHLCFIWEKHWMLKLTTCIFVCTWSPCDFIMKVDAGLCTHTHIHAQSRATGVERVLFVWKDWTPSYFSSHISSPPPPFSLFTPFLSHLLEAAALVLSLFHISKIPVHL